MSYSMAYIGTESLKAFLRGTKNICNCDSRHPDGVDIGELESMKRLPVTALRYGGALYTSSSITTQLGPLKCTGKVGVYPSDIELEEKRVLENRLDIFNQTLRERRVLLSMSTFKLPSGYKKVETDFGMVVYKLYTTSKTRPEAMKTCTSDGSFLHFPQPTNEKENLFYYDLIYPSLISDYSSSDYSSSDYSSVYTSDNTKEIWLDISKSNSWSNWAENAGSSYWKPYTTMIFKTGEREKNWNHVPSDNVCYFVCTAAFK